MIRPAEDLLDGYLADLTNRLAGADPAERADIVASVREHVEADLAMLDRPATAADVQASLNALGSVDVVAAAWAPEHTGDASGPAAPSSIATGLRELPTAVTVAGVLTAITLILLVTVAPLALPTAVAALVAGIVALRRHREGRAVSITATVIGAVLTLASVVILLGTAAFFMTTTQTVETGGSEVAVVPTQAP